MKKTILWVILGSVIGVFLLLILALVAYLALFIGFGTYAGHQANQEELLLNESDLVYVKASWNTNVSDTCEACKTNKSECAVTSRDWNLEVLGNRDLTCALYINNQVTGSTGIIRGEPKNINFLVSFTPYEDNAYIDEIYNMEVCCGVVTDFPGKDYKMICKNSTLSPICQN